MKKVILNSLNNAGEVLINRFEKRLTVTLKENQSSIVTNADLESEKVIIDTITRSYPDHNIMSEECGFIGHGSDYTWIIDPLDGTSNFAAGIPWFGVLIAVMKADIPVLAGACLPLQRDIYFAEQGKGSFKNGKPIHTASAENLKEMLVAFSTDYSTDESFMDQGLQKLKKLISASRNIRCTNSLVDFLYVAEGKYGACLNLFTRIWDIASPWLIITEAGGYMSTLAGAEIQFTAGKAVLTRNYSVITASNTFKPAIDRMMGLPG